MELTLSEHSAASFRLMMENIAELIVGDINITFNANGLFIEQVDSSHVALITLTLLGGFFEKYKCTTGHTIGVNLPTFLKFLKRLRNGEKLTLITSDDPTEMTTKMQVIFGEGNEQTGYLMNLVDLNIERQNIPPIAYFYTIQMDIDRWTRMLGDMAVLEEDILVIGLTKKLLLLSIEGKQKGMTTLPLSYVKFTVNEPAMKGWDQMKEDWEVNYRFSLKFLMKIAAKHKGGQITIELAEAAPIRICFVYGSVGRMVYYLAPKIEGED